MKLPLMGRWRRRPHKQISPGPCEDPADTPSFRPYKYQPLSPGEIRILTVLPGAFDDPVQGSLRVVSLDDCPPYKAVSYAWGDPSLTQAFQLVEGCIEITPSLYGALQRFRDPVQPIALWTDQVCINQKHLAELSKQVSIMARIYSRAERVLVWLGGSIDTDTLAFWTIKVVGEGAFSQTGRACKDVQQYIARRLYERRRAACPTPTCPCCKGKLPSDFSTRDAIDAVATLVQRPYFERLWPVQEVAMAKRVTYHAGRHYTSWWELEGTLHLFSIAQLCYPLFSIKSAPFDLTADADHSRYSALETVIHTAAYDVSEMRDRIFAIRALTSDRDDVRLLPNYSMPVEELWRRTALSALQAGPPTTWSDAHNSMPLSLAGLSNALGSALQWSWVPNLGIQCQEYQRKRSYWKQYSSTFLAGGGTRRFTIEHNDQFPDRIDISGIIHCRVRAVLADSQCNFGFLTSHRFRTDEERWHDVEYSVILWYFRCRQFVLANDVADLSPGSLESLLRQGVFPWSGQYPAEGGDKHFHRRVQAKYGSAGYDVPDSWEIHYDLQTFLSLEPFYDHIDTHRVLASLDNGTVGWVPELTLPGDAVCLLQGSPFPFVFRGRDDGTYRNMGDAYVPHTMQGEAWPGDVQGLQRLTIR